MDEIDEASDRVLMGPAKVSRKVTDYEKNIVAYHESGHAVLGIELVFHLKLKLKKLVKLVNF